jgi:hypothetical protein
MSYLFFKKMELREAVKKLDQVNPRARICKRLRSPVINSKESIPPAYVAWLAGTSNKVVIREEPGKGASREMKRTNRIRD